MRSIRGVGLATGVLTDEEIEFIDTKIVKTVLPVLVARPLFAKVPLGSAGFRKVTYYTEKEMGPALVDMEAQGESLDTAPREPHSVAVPVIHKETMLYWRDVQLKRQTGQDLETSHIEAATRKVVEEEDLLLLSGEYSGVPAMGIQGLLSATGRQTQATAGAWGTQANIWTDVNACIDKLEAEGYYGPYKFLLPPALRSKLRVHVTSTDKWVFEAVGELIGGVENIIVSGNLYVAADGGVDSGVLCQPGPDNFDVCVGADIHHIRETQKGNIWVSVREALVPRIKRPKSIVELTGIT